MVCVPSLWVPLPRRARDMEASINLGGYGVWRPLDWRLTGESFPLRTTAALTNTWGFGGENLDYKFERYLGLCARKIHGKTV